MATCPGEKLRRVEGKRRKRKLDRRWIGCKEQKADRMEKKRGMEEWKGKKNQLEKKEMKERKRRWKVGDERLTYRKGGEEK